MKWKSWLERKFEYLFILDRWNIGYGTQTAEELIQTRKLTDEICWLQEDKPEYAADPFTVCIGGKTLIYYEELSFWHGKGRLKMIISPEINSKRNVVGIGDDNIHLSYPYIFEDGGNVYCIPETATKKEVALYEIDKKHPEKLNRLFSIVSGERYVDSSMIFHKNSYWVFTSISGESDRLYIYYANKLSEKFKPHALNPIYMKFNTARSAGRPFVVDNKLYLPCQNPEKCYGGSVTIHEIVDLSATTFNCKRLFDILPKPPYNRGLHTLNFYQDKVIIDGKRPVFSPIAILKKICKKLRNR